MCHHFTMYTCECDGAAMSQSDTEAVLRSVDHWSVTTGH